MYLYLRGSTVSATVIPTTTIWTIHFYCKWGSLKMTAFTGAKFHNQGQPPVDHISFQQSVRFIHSFSQTKYKNVTLALTPTQSLWDCVYVCIYVCGCCLQFHLTLHSSSHYSCVLLLLFFFFFRLAFVSHRLLPISSLLNMRHNFCVFTLIFAKYLAWYFILLSPFYDAK